MSQPQQPKAAEPPTNTIDNILVHFSKQLAVAHGIHQGGAFTEAQVYAQKAQNKAKAAINKTIMEDVLDCLPRVSDLDSPLQQSWKLGGTDEESFRRGFLQALTAVRQQLTKKYGGSDV